MASIVPWRGHEVSRIEGFSDAVFGFALTLLVVSLEVPSSFEELLGTMRGFLAFALCFAVVAWIWYEHNLFFRRYGLQDGLTIVLNCVLLFVVLFYVYPLKFLFTYLVGHLMGMGSEGGVPVFRRASEPQQLMLIYSVGFLVLFLTFAVLYNHAWRRRAELGLGPAAGFEARAGRGAHLLNAGVGAASILIALLGGARAASWAGWIYALLGPLHGFYWSGVARRRQRLAAETPA
jgi:uncharacterized membrane protein